MESDLLSNATTRLRSYLMSFDVILVLYIECLPPASLCRLLLWPSRSQFPVMVVLLANRDSHYCVCKNSVTSTWAYVSPARRDTIPQWFGLVSHVRLHIMSPIYIEVSLCFYVFSCYPYVSLVSSCFSMFSPDSPYFPVFFYVSPCFLLFFYVFPCFSLFFRVFFMFSSGSPCFPLFFYVFPGFPMFFYVFPWFSLFFRVFLCFPLIPPVSPCFSTFSPVSPCF